MNRLSVIKMADESLIIMIDGKAYNVGTDHPHRVAILECLASDAVFAKQTVDDLLAMLSFSGRRQRAWEELVGAGFEPVEGSGVRFKEQMLPEDLGSYLSDMIANMGPAGVQPIVNFTRKLWENPNQHTRMTAFTFIQNSRLPILPNGNMMGYKIVTADYMDKKTQTIYNGPGTTVPELPWRDVDTNPKETCSYGYHVCSQEYLHGNSAFFYDPGDRVVSVSVNPEDIGSIPADYDHSKLRCRKYEVIEDVTDQWLEDHDAPLEFGGGQNFNVVNEERDPDRKNGFLNFFSNIIK